MTRKVTNKQQKVLSKIQNCVLLFSVNQTDIVVYTRRIRISSIRTCRSTLYRGNECKLSYLKSLAYFQHSRWRFLSNTFSHLYSTLQWVFYFIYYVRKKQMPCLYLFSKQIFICRSCTERVVVLWFRKLIIRWPDEAWQSRQHLFLYRSKFLGLFKILESEKFLLTNITQITKDWKRIGFIRMSRDLFKIVEERLTLCSCNGKVIVIYATDWWMIFRQ